VSSDLPVEPGIEAAPVQGAAPQGVFPVLAKDGGQCHAEQRFPLEAVMTDRELLELAAKAGGNAGGYSRWWDPLEDDGDAFRLAVKLKLDLYCHEAGAMVNDEAGNVFDENDRREDPCAGARRAIVRAAAEIGRTS
jgi:hypothetical protein